MNTFWLEPHNGQKSFYKKAYVVEFDNGAAVLFSYKTPVFLLTEGKGLYRLWSGESKTTLNHVNSFLAHYGLADKGGGVKWWRNLVALEGIARGYKDLPEPVSKKRKKGGNEKMVISNEVFNSLVKEMYDVLVERYYYPTMDGVTAIVKKSVEKKSSLINLLRKHPKWDEKELRIHFDEEYTRPIDNAVATYKMQQIHERIESDQYDLSAWLSLYEKIPMEAFTDEYKKKIEEEKAYHDKIALLARFTTGGIVWRDWGMNASVTPEMASRALRYNREGEPEIIHVKVGAKSTKAYWKMLRELGIESVKPDLLHDIQRMFAEYSDAMNPLTVTRHTVLSVNPTDFLLMSNGNSWTSCQDIGSDPDSAGCYSAGALSYPMDEETMIFYTVDGSVDVEDITLAGKVTRQLYFWNGSLLTGSRVYPQENDGESGIYQTQRSIVEKIMSDCLEQPNLWKRLPNKADYVSNGMHYRDYDCWTYPSFHLSNMSGVYSVHTIGGFSPCPRCGEIHNDDSYDNKILCCECQDGGGRRVQCADCGEWIDVEDAIYDEEHDEYYCYDCTYVCYHCGERRPLRYGRTNCHDEFFCDECVDNGYAMRCAECDEYFDCDELVYDEYHDNWVCQDCWDEISIECDECEGRFVEEELVHRVDPETGVTHRFCHKCAAIWDENHAATEDSDEDDVTILEAA